MATPQLHLGLVDRRLLRGHGEARPPSVGHPHQGGWPQARGHLHVQATKERVDVDEELSQ